MIFFFTNSKPHWKYVFESLKRVWLIILPYYTNVIKFEMTLNLKHGTEKLKLKPKDTETWKNQNKERLKRSFAKRIGRKCRLI